MKTNTFTVVANQRALLVSRNAENNLKNNSEDNSSAVQKGDFSKDLFCFHCNFCFRNGTELGNYSN